ncbi:MAG: hypothetical protein AAGA27_00435 [Pseudomonadota bacterium]
MRRITKKLIIVVGTLFAIANASNVLAEYYPYTTYFAVACVADYETVDTYDDKNNYIAAAAACEGGASTESQDQANQNAINNANASCDTLMAKNSTGYLSGCDLSLDSYVHITIDAYNNDTCVGAGAAVEDNTGTTVVAKGNFDDVDSTIGDSINEYKQHQYVEIICPHTTNANTTPIYFAIACVAEYTSEGKDGMGVAAVCEGGASTESQDQANQNALNNANASCDKLISQGTGGETQSCGLNSKNYTYITADAYNNNICVGAGAAFEEEGNKGAAVVAKGSLSDISSTINNGLGGINTLHQDVEVICPHNNTATTTYNMSKNLSKSYTFSHDVKGKDIVSLNVYPTMQNTSLYISAGDAATKDVDVVVSSVMTAYVDTDKSTCLANMRKEKNGDLIGHPDKLPCTLELKPKNITSSDVGYITVNPSVKGNATHWNTESRILPVNLYSNYNDYLLYHANESESK